jgi:hypothetical protein
VRGIGGRSGIEFAVVGAVDPGGRDGAPSTRCDTATSRAAAPAQAKKMSPARRGDTMAWWPHASLSMKDM